MGRPGDEATCRLIPRHHACYLRPGNEASLHSLGNECAMEVFPEIDVPPPSHFSPGLGW